MSPFLKLGSVELPEDMIRQKERYCPDSVRVLSFKIKPVIISPDSFFSIGETFHKVDNPRVES